jgi:uncharacterized protein YciI
VLETGRVEFLCYHRDRAGSDPLRDELGEAHWTYMDGSADRMILRGPTLTEDREFATGSIHILDLPGPAEARAFAFEEPNYQAGVYRDVLLRRWSNRLGRTMWQFPRYRDDPHFLVLGFGEPRPIQGAPDESPTVDTDRLIAVGPLLTDDGMTWLGSAVVLKAPTPDEARAVLTESAYAQVEVHSWQSVADPDEGVAISQFTTHIREPLAQYPSKDASPRPRSAGSTDRAVSERRPGFTAVKRPRHTPTLHDLGDHRAAPRAARQSGAVVESHRLADLLLRRPHRDLHPELRAVRRLRTAAHRLIQTGSEAAGASTVAVWASLRVGYLSPGSDLGHQGRRGHAVAFGAGGGTMFYCERCGSGFNAAAGRSPVECPRCRARDGVFFPLTFGLSERWREGITSRTRVASSAQEGRRPALDADASTEVG